MCLGIWLWHMTEWLFYIKQALYITEPCLKQQITLFVMMLTLQSHSNSDYYCIIHLNN